MAQLVKHLAAVWEAGVQLLGWEAPLEEGAAAHSSVRAQEPLYLLVPVPFPTLCLTYVSCL